MSARCWHTVDNHLGDDHRCQLDLGHLGAHSEVRPEPVDWKNIAVQLAASNARLCKIALHGDELAKAVEALVQDAPSGLYINLRTALADYKITRNGQ